MARGHEPGDYFGDDRIASTAADGAIALPRERSSAPGFALMSGDVCRPGCRQCPYARNAHLVAWRAGLTSTTS
jgi:hypothetical protein